MNVIRLIRNSLLLCLIFCCITSEAQTPAKKQEKSILLLNGVAHLGTGEVIPQSAIGFSNGKIDMVLAAVDYQMDSTKYDTIIHIDGQHVYPGFISPNSRLGLIEIGAVRATRDSRDVGKFNPHVRSLIAYNTDSRIIPTVRTNGVLMVETTPAGGRISGTSSIMELDGWNWEDAAYKVDNGIHLNWPSNWNSLGQNKEKDTKAAKKYQQELRELKDFFDQAFAYHQADYQLEKDLRFESMKGLFNGEKKLFVHANWAQHITDAVYFLDQYQIEWVLVGAYEALPIAELLKDRKIPVLVRRVHSLPAREDHDIDLPFKLPHLLKEKGLLVGLENSGDMEASATRNLPFYAGTVAAYGMEKEDALATITLNTAKILGINQLIGSLEVGKYATLFVSKGDALDMRSNEVTYAFIKGKGLELTNPQIQLYKKYSKKYNSRN